MEAFDIQMVNGTKGNLLITRKKVSVHISIPMVELRQGSGKIIADKVVFYSHLTFKAYTNRLP